MMGKLSGGRREICAFPGIGRGRKDGREENKSNEEREVMAKGTEEKSKKKGV